MQPATLKIVDTLLMIPHTFENKYHLGSASAAPTAARHRRCHTTLVGESTKPVALPSAPRRSDSAIARLGLERPAAGKVFIANKTGSFIASPNGHYHKLSPRHIGAFQSFYSPALNFSPCGLESMRRKYEEIRGVPPFLRAILQLDTRSQELRALVRHPELCPYLPCSNRHGGFLVLNNQPFDPSFATHRAPKSQKLSDDGIHLCAWFINPEEESVTPQTRLLLAELATGTWDGPVLSALRVKIDEDKRTVKDVSAWGDKPNICLPKPLTSILDLRAAHADVLSDLQSKLRTHLQRFYGVDFDEDQVDIFCHWPYREVAATLHVQVRVNQTIHPVDASNVFSLDELSGYLRQPGNCIDTLLLQRQENNGCVFYGPKIEYAEFGGLEGVTFSTKKNVFRLDGQESNRKGATAESRNLGDWLHDNRTYGMAIDGRLDDSGQVHILMLRGKQYVAKRELGRGCSALVTLFEDENTGEKVVVKSLRRENRGGKYQIVLYKERNTLAYLDSALTPQQRDRIVAPIGAVISNDNTPSLVFPFHPGGSVHANAARIKSAFEGGELNADERLNLTKLMMLDIAEAKQALESVNVVHIDPHGENFILGADGRARLIDFGCAEIIPPTLPPLPRETMEMNLALPISYDRGDNFRPPEDKEVGPLFDSFVVGTVFKALMTPIAEELPSLLAGETSLPGDRLRTVGPADLRLFADLLNRMLAADKDSRPNATEIIQNRFFDDTRASSERLRNRMCDLISKQSCATEVLA